MIHPLTQHRAPPHPINWISHLRRGVHPPTLANPARNVVAWPDHWNLHRCFSGGVHFFIFRSGYAGWASIKNWARIGKKKRITAFWGMHIDLGKGLMEFLFFTIHPFLVILAFRP